MYYLLVYILQRFWLSIWPKPEITLVDIFFFFLVEINILQKILLNFILIKLLDPTTNLQAIHMTEGLMVVQQ